MEELILKRLLKYGFVIENYKILGAYDDGRIAVYYGDGGRIMGVIIANTLEYRLKISSAMTYLKMKNHSDITINTVLLMDKKTITEEEARELYLGDSGIIYVNYQKKILGSIGAGDNFVSILGKELSDSGKESKPLKITATNVIIAVNIIIYIISAILSKNFIDINPYVLIAMGAKWNPLIKMGQYYRLITAFFLHGGIIHIALNMYALKLIGNIVEKIYGPRKFLIIYFLSGIASNIASYAFSTSLSVGASGAIFGILGAALIIGYNKRGTIGNKFFQNVLTVIIVNVIIGLTASNIDNFAHFGGLLVGTIISALLYKGSMMR